jgi:hypothetical protein
MTFGSLRSIELMAGVRVDKNAYRILVWKPLRKLPFFVDRGDSGRLKM